MNHIGRAIATAVVTICLLIHPNISDAKKKNGHQKDKSIPEVVATKCAQIMGDSEIEISCKNLYGYKSKCELGKNGLGDPLRRCIVINKQGELAGFIYELISKTKNLQN